MLSFAGLWNAEVPTPTLCVRERASHSWPLTCLSPPPVCVYLLGTELDESFKEFGKNREVMGLCREGESSPPGGVYTQPWGSFLVASLLAAMRMLLKRREAGGQNVCKNLISMSSVMGSDLNPLWKPECNQKSNSKLWA